MRPISDPREAIPVERSELSNASYVRRCTLKQHNGTQARQDEVDYVSGDGPGCWSTDTMGQDHRRGGVRLHICLAQAYIMLSARDEPRRGLAYVCVKNVFIFMGGTGVPRQTNSSCRKEAKRTRRSSMRYAALRHITVAQVYRPRAASARQALVEGASSYIPRSTTRLVRQRNSS